jgi:putative tryptophan/tyrosine transport system substrate-binding protein
VAIRKVGFLHNRSKRSFQVHFAAFVNRMYRFVEQEDVIIVEKWAGDDATRKSLQEHATDLINQDDVDVIVAAGGPQSAQAVQVVRETLKATTEIPIVFTPVADPVGLGLVNDLDRPTTNSTGIAGMTSELDVNRLQLMGELLRDRAGATIGCLNNKDRPNQQLQEMQDEAARLKFNLEWMNVVDLPGIESEFASKSKCDAFLVMADSLFNDLRKDVVGFPKGVPAIYQWREFTEAGGLMSFGPNIIEAYEKVGEYVGHILRDTSPADLPVSFPDRFELVINLRVAQTNKIKIPASLLSRAEIVPSRL